MPATNEALADRIVRHQTYIQRFGSGTTARVIGLLNRSDADIVQQIERRATRIADRGFDSGPETTKRLNNLLGEVRSINRAAYQAAGRELTDQLRNLADYESDWQTGALESALQDIVSLRRVPTRLVVAAATSRPFQGRLLKEWLDGLEASRAARIRDAIRLGLVQGQTVQQMVRRIRGTRAASYADGLLEIDRRGAATVVRTAVNHTANVARQATWEENADLISGVQWHSTLDGRTCPVCGGLDGKVFPLKSGPRPPEHHGCRCTTVPITKSWRELGLDIDDISPGTRASMDGQVPASLTYGQWLQRQSNAFQDEVLGKGKAELFRSGIPIERFTDRSGNELSLKQLRVADPPSVRVEAQGKVPSLGGKLTPTQLEAESSALEYVMVNGARDQIEYAAAYAADGSEVLRKSGEASSVSFSPAEQHALRGATLVHNHPRGTSLSGADMIFAARVELREILAVPSAGGGLFRAAPVLAWGDVSAAHQAADRHVYRRMSAAISAGKLTHSQADALHAHMVNSAMDQVGAVAYKANLTPAIQDAIGAFGAGEFEAAVKEFKWSR